MTTLTWTGTNWMTPDGRTVDYVTNMEFSQNAPDNTVEATGPMSFEGRDVPHITLPTAPIGATFNVQGPAVVHDATLDGVRIDDQYPLYVINPTVPPWNDLTEVMTDFTRAEMRRVSFFDRIMPALLVRANSEAINRPLHWSVSLARYTMTFAVRNHPVAKVKIVVEAPHIAEATHQADQAMRAQFNDFELLGWLDEPII